MNSFINYKTYYLWSKLQFHFNLSLINKDLGINAQELK